MSDDLVKQALAEIGDVVRCCCHEAYTGRGMHDPACNCDSADAVRVVADRIEELEAKLAKAVEALERVMVGGNHLAIWLPDDHPTTEAEPLAALEQIGAGVSYDVWCCWRVIMLARNTLAELKGDEP